MTGPAAKKKTSRSVRFTLSAAAVVLTLTAAACGNDFYEIPIETPIQAKLDVSAFQRVLVAGFVAGGTDDVDANQETVRLLRSQLRTKSSLKVIDADIMPLIEIAQEQRKAANNDDSSATHTNGTNGASNGSSNGNGTAAERGPQAPTSQNQTMALPLQIREEKDLEPYERLFANVAYWKKIGEEYQNPLIVTGTVLFTPHSRSGYVQREQDLIDQYGRHRVVPVRAYMERKGFI